MKERSVTLKGKVYRVTLEERGGTTLSRIVGRASVYQSGGPVTVNDVGCPGGNGTIGVFLSDFAPEDLGAEVEVTITVRPLARE